MYGNLSVRFYMLMPFG